MSLEENRVKSSKAGGIVGLAKIDEVSANKESENMRLDSELINQKRIKLTHIGSQ
jgi:hypothetical protein